MLPQNTDRLAFCEFDNRDFGILHSLYSHPQVHTYLPTEPHSDTDTQAFVKKIIEERQTRPRRSWTLGLFHVYDGSFLGTCTLSILDTQLKIACINCDIFPSVRHEGYATEAMKSLIAFGLQDLGLHRLFGTCRPDDMARIEMMEQAEMYFEGVHRKDVLIHGKWGDSVVYAILEN